MPHVLILGTTEIGKTTLAKRLAADYQKAGISVIVLDPIADPAFPADYRTTNPDEFLEVFWQSRSCAAFIDEAGDAVGKYNDVMNRTATRGRHWGHNVHYITQRASLLSTTVRDQCSRLYLFRSGLKDCEKHAEEWTNPELKKAASLKAGEYYLADRQGNLSRHNIFTAKR
jgi:DNA helicase HerA-like ATPase